MSEIPALLFILAGSYFFLMWLETERPLHCLTAFGMAEVAFLSKVTTAGVLPAWFMFAAVNGKFQRLLSGRFVQAASLYLGINIAWVVFVTGFSKYEVMGNTDFALVKLLSWENVLFYPTHLPAMLGWGTLIAGLAGAVYTGYLVTRGKRFPLGLFWLSWFFSYYIFQLALSINEQRYFLFALPCFSGLIACLFSQHGSKMLRERIAPCLLGLGIVVNVAQFTQFPRGIVGYDAVAKQLARLDKPGNVLIATSGMRDLIFRYRALRPTVKRAILRADRTLAVRFPGYAGIEPKVLAQSFEDVLDIFGRGRVRYLVTYSPSDTFRDIRTKEMLLAHDVAQSLPESFTLLGKSPLLIEYGAHGITGQIFVWEFRGELPGGSRKIPVVIPTANLELNCP